MKKFPVVPAIAAAGIGVLLLMSSSSASAKGGGVEPPVPPPPPPHPNTRPKKPSNPPAGSGSAIVAPVCGPNDPAKCRNGLIVRTAPSTAAPMVSPEDISPTSKHALTGDEVALMRVDIPDESPTKTSRLWAHVMTPLGNTGFVSYIDLNGDKNFTSETKPAADVVPVNVAGMAGPNNWGFSPFLHFSGNGGQSRFARCTAPSGCRLRTGSPMMPSIVPSGGMLQVLNQASGQTYVRYHDPLRGAVDGWIDSRWLA